MKTLVFPFLWGSKIETVSTKSLSVSAQQGGPGLIDFVCKSKALKVSALVNTIDNPDTKAFLLMNYLIGSQLARLRGEWSHLRDNSFPSALAPSKYDECVFNSLVNVIKRIPANSSFCFLLRIDPCSPVQVVHFTGLPTTSFHSLIPYS